MAIQDFLGYPSTLRRLDFSKMKYLGAVLSPFVLKQVLAHPSELLPRQGATIKDPVGAWEAKGCFQDSVQNRVLGFRFDVDGTNDAESCTAQCHNKGYKFAGMEYGTECWCGNALAYEIPKPAAECSFVCPGDSTELCGAGDRIVIYEDTDPAPQPVIKQSYGTWSYKACYRDLGTRLLTYRFALPNDNKVETCTALCQSNGYALAGIEYGTECWCDHYLPYGGQVPDAECNFSCPGDPLQRCGGSMRLQIYLNSAGTPLDTTQCIDWRALWTWGGMRLRAVRKSGLGAPEPLYYVPTLPLTDPKYWMYLAACNNACSGSPFSYGRSFTLQDGTITTLTSSHRILPPQVGQAQLFIAQNPQPYAGYNQYCAKPNPASAEGPFIGSPRLAVGGRTDEWAFCYNTTDSGRPTVVYHPLAGNAHYVLSQCEEIWIEMYHD
ncbi:WSC domain-containing protein [Panaeolus papilionaceus]|nr:WSC domain-containing protein [Panaeolus papilionaceus]